MAEGGGLLNVDQPLGHLRFSLQILTFQAFLDQPTCLQLAPEAPFWELAGTILGTVLTNDQPLAVTTCFLDVAVEADGWSARLEAAGPPNGRTLPPHLASEGSNASASAM